jgi:apolipoprotein N-acyltransferase
VTTSRLSTVAALVLAVASVASFQIAYEWKAAAGFIVAYLACLFRLAWVKSSRWAFYLGLAIGFSIAAAQLRFFYDIFGPAAIGLWLIFGLWHAFYLLLARNTVARWPRSGALCLPVIWFALEYFRSELYYLRFAWLTPGFALSHPTWLPFATVGVYGFSFCVLSIIALLFVGSGRKRWLTISAALLFSFALGFSGKTADKSGPYVVGVQLESPTKTQVLHALDQALKDHPQLEMVVLSEYTFDGPVPARVLEWCTRNQKHLVAGGKEPAENGQFYNTVYVISPAGEVVFRQGKSVPIQFFNDGLPASSQHVWKSPWGKIGIAICYDLSYARVIDRLIASGAESLIIPTVDLEEWGAHEHWLHSKIAPVRAREYGVPIFRVASSGISQLVSANGRVVASAPFPGQNQQLAGLLPMGQKGSLPWDRYLAMPAVIVVAGLSLYLWIARKSAPGVRGT